MKVLLIFLTITYFVNVDCHQKDTSDKPLLAPTTSKTNFKSKAFDQTSFLKCAVENKMDKKMLRGIFFLAEASTQALSLTDKQIDFAICVAKNVGLVNDDASWNESFVDDFDDSITHKCKNLGGGDQNEIASKIIQCLFRVY